MEQTELLYAIGRYCKSQNFEKTLKSLNTSNIQKPEEQNLTLIFEKYFKPKDKGEGLSFTFKLRNKRSKLRKRLLNNENDQPVAIKKMKLMKVRKNDIPDAFLNLLDELGLDKKNAKLLYEHKDQWAYVKSDQLIYCVKRGKFLYTYI